MSQTVDLEVFYPHPPERVWRVLTDRRALAAWMMDNTFEPTLGHRFQFYSPSLLGFTTTIHCRVVELEEPTRLVYTWQESLTSEPSLVIWTLTAVAGGTQLRLKHAQHSYAPVGAPTPSGVVARAHSMAGWFHATHFPAAQAEIPSAGSIVQNRTRSNPFGSAITLPNVQTFTWEYCLNQKLLSVLAQEE